ncbi:hypothetical protein BGZ76_001625 [Entomortierella beljakovae]|nr:hypothetical protein BGZ76_001625 [Entomortierella beljakovae]
METVYLDDEIIEEYLKEGGVVYDENGEKKEIPKDRKGYIAISHTWGDWKPYTAEQLNIKGGIHWEVGMTDPKKLERIVAAVKEMKKKYCWVDTLCIPQGNNKMDLLQKSKEIANMGYYYSNACMTLVMATKAEFQNERSKLAGVVDSAVVSFRDWGFRYGKPTFISSQIGLNHEDWFSRVWTYQEAIFSQKIIYVSFDGVFHELNEFLESSAAPIERSPYEEPTQMDVFAAVGNARKERANKNSTTILTTMYRTCLRICQQKQDRYYGVMALLGYSFEADYNMPMDMLNKEFIKKATKGGDVTWLCVGGSARKEGFLQPMHQRFTYVGKGWKITDGREETNDMIVELEEYGISFEEFLKEYQGKHKRKYKELKKKEFEKEFKKEFDNDFKMKFKGQYKEQHDDTFHMECVEKFKEEKFKEELGEDDFEKFMEAKAIEELGGKDKKEKVNKSNVLLKFEEKFRMEIGKGYKNEFNERKAKYEKEDMASFTKKFMEEKFEETFKNDIEEIYKSHGYGNLYLRACHVANVVYCESAVGDNGFGFPDLLEKLRYLELSNKLDTLRSHLWSLEYLKKFKQPENFKQPEEHWNDDLEGLPEELKEEWGILKKKMEERKGKGKWEGEEEESDLSNMLNELFENEVSTLSTEQSTSSTKQLTLSTLTDILRISMDRINSCHMDLSRVLLGFNTKGKKDAATKGKKDADESTKEKQCAYVAKAMKSAGSKSLSNVLSTDLRLTSIVEGIVGGTATTLVKKGKKKLHDVINMTLKRNELLTRLHERCSKLKIVEAKSVFNDDSILLLVDGDVGINDKIMMLPMKDEDGNHLCIVTNGFDPLTNKPYNIPDTQPPCTLTENPDLLTYALHRKGVCLYYASKDDKTQYTYKQCRYRL